MKNVNITLIGMSNVGKSFWRRRLESAGFASFSCDDRIEAKLATYLTAHGYRGIQDVARWMGQSYEPHYKECAARYLAQEKEVMKEAIAMLQQSERNLVVDTTGSVIYMEEEILRRLRELSTIVFLDAPEGAEEKLCRSYHTEPKPVIWGDMYRSFPGESPADALARCYPMLLRSRSAMYRRHADVVLDYNELRMLGFATEGFLSKIRRGVM